MSNQLKTTMEAPFRFINPGRLIDRDFYLKLVARHPAKKYVPRYDFEVRKIGTSRKIGTIRLRIGSARKLRCPGHMGYEVIEKHRGHRYAARSCRLLFPLARAHGLKALWLTVNPKNLASRRSCELAGARYVDTIRIPRDHEMHRDGGRFLCRYRIKLLHPNNYEKHKSTDHYFNPGHQRGFAPRGRKPATDHRDHRRFRRGSPSH